MTVDGHDLRDVTERSLRGQLGMVPQEGFLFSGTIRDNIAFGRPDATEAELREAAGRSAPTSSSSACRTATTPRWASAAGTSPPASASWWPSPAPQRPTRAS